MPMNRQPTKRSAIAVATATMAAVQGPGTQPSAGMMDSVHSVGMSKDAFAAWEKSRPPSETAMTSLRPSWGLTAQSS